MEHPIFQILADLLQPDRHPQIVINLRYLDPLDHGEPRVKDPRKLPRAIGLIDLDLAIACRQLHGISDLELYQVLHRLTQDREVRLWYYLDYEEMPMYYLVTDRDVALPWTKNGHEFGITPRCEIGQVRLYWFGDTRTLMNMGKISDRIVQIIYIKMHPYSYATWWEIVLEYARAPVDLVRETRLATLLRSQIAGTTLGMIHGQQYLEQIIAILDAESADYSDGCPLVTIGKGDMNCHQTILPKILEPHYQIRPAKSARSAEYDR